MQEDKIKLAFSKAKQDIQDIKLQISELSNQIQSLKSLVKKTEKPTDTIIQHTSNIQQTNPQETPTDNFSESQNLPLKASKASISTTSTGNGGVPTDRQTDQQTDRHINLHTNSNIRRVSELLESLDDIKSEVRLKFKHLTKQEMLVFSIIYQLEDSGNTVDYNLIASKLSLTESSVRDYIHKMIKKGIPIVKTKENNKKVFLSISPELKQIASLDTIIKLREL